MVIDHMKMEGTLEDEDITRKEEEDCRILMIITIEGIQEGPIMMEDPLIVEDP